MVLAFHHLLLLLLLPQVRGSPSIPGKVRPVHLICDLLQRLVCDILRFSCYPLTYVIYAQAHQIDLCPTKGSTKVSMNRQNCSIKRNSFSILYSPTREFTEWYFAKTADSRRWKSHFLTLHLQNGHNFRKDKSKHQILYHEVSLKEIVTLWSNILVINDNTICILVSSVCNSRRLIVLVISLFLAGYSEPRKPLILLSQQLES
jgi:hypothetical protein